MLKSTRASRPNACGCGRSWRTTPKSSRCSPEPRRSPTRCSSGPILLLGQCAVHDRRAGAGRAIRPTPIREFIFRSEQADAQRGLRDPADLERDAPHRRLRRARDLQEVLERRAKRLAPVAALEPSAAAPGTPYASAEMPALCSRSSRARFRAATCSSSSVRPGPYAGAVLGPARQRRQPLARDVSRIQPLIARSQQRQRDRRGDRSACPGAALRRRRARRAGPRERMAAAVLAARGPRALERRR